MNVDKPDCANKALTAGIPMEPFGADCNFLMTVFQIIVFFSILTFFFILTRGSSSLLDKTSIPSKPKVSNSLGSEFFSSQGLLC